MSGPASTTVVVYKVDRLTRSLAAFAKLVDNRWKASMSRCFMDTEGSTMSVSHKTARADPFVRGFANSPWTGSSVIGLSSGDLGTSNCQRRFRLGVREFLDSGPVPHFESPGAELGAFSSVEDHRFRV